MACLRPALLALVSCALLAGCSAMPASPRGGGTPPAEIPLEVLAARLEPGRCFDGAEAFGEVCHVLTVQIDNTGRTNRLATNALTWDAVDADGKVHDFGDSDADAVAGGMKVTLTVSFTTPDGNADLVQLQYSSFAAKGEAAVPSY